MCVLHRVESFSVCPGPLVLPYLTTNSHTDSVLYDEKFSQSFSNFLDTLKTVLKEGVCEEADVARERVKEGKQRG